MKPEAETGLGTDVGMRYSVPSGHSWDHRERTQDDLDFSCQQDNFIRTNATTLGMPNWVPPVLSAAPKPSAIKPERWRCPQVEQITLANLGTAKWM